MRGDLYSLGQYGSTQLVGVDCQPPFKASANAHYVITEPAEVITNVTFPVHCRAVGRGFSHCWRFVGARRYGSQMAPSADVAL